MIKLFVLFVVVGVKFSSLQILNKYQIVVKCIQIYEYIIVRICMLKKNIPIMKY